MEDIIERYCDLITDTIDALEIARLLNKVSATYLDVEEYLLLASINNAKGRAMELLTTLAVSGKTDALAEFFRILQDNHPELCASIPEISTVEKLEIKLGGLKALKVLVVNGEPFVDIRQYKLTSSGDLYADPKAGLRFHMVRWAGLLEEISFREETKHLSCEDDELYKDGCYHIGGNYYFETRYICEQIWLRKWAIEPLQNYKLLPTDVGIKLLSSEFKCLTDNIQLINSVLPDNVSTLHCCHNNSVGELQCDECSPNRAFYEAGLIELNEGFAY